MPSISLTPAERQDLLDRYRRSAEPEIRLRAHILLLLDAGFPWATISAVLFCSLSTISRWKARFEAEGVDAVFGRPRGRRRSGVHIWAALVARWVLTLSPTEFRFARSRWSCEAAAVVLREDFRVRVGRETVRSWLRDADLVWRRPRPVIRPKDPDREKKLSALRALLKGLPETETAVFMDEVDVNLNPKVGCMWMKRGEQAAVETPGNNEKRYLAGSIHWRTGRVILTEGRPREGRSAALFCRHLDDLRRAFRHYKVNATHRERFVTAVLGKVPAADRVALEDELLQLAAGAVPASPASDWPEVDIRRVVRPELFHTPAVSGVSVAVANPIGGRLVRRWRTYLRWEDGRREVIDRPESLPLPDGSTLYVCPDPGEPGAGDPPGWSAEARRRWLAGGSTPNPAELFKKLCERIAFFLDFPQEAAAGTTATVALWSILTYLYPAWDAVPYLYVGGPMGSGKSRLLEVLARLTFRPLASANLTAPALFRTLHARGGTMIYDEAERLRQTTPEMQELNSVFLAGYKRGGTATRLEPAGDSFRPVQFDVFGPKSLACIAGLPPTLASRTIQVMMLRAWAGSPKPKRRIDADVAGWQALRDELHALALSYGPTWSELALRADVAPAMIASRNYELWQPILALAWWVESHGAGGLLNLVQRHALAAVEGAKDDGIPEADETLLEVLVEFRRAGGTPTPGELLQRALGRDPVTFKGWQPAGVTRRLKAYGIPPPKKSNGTRRYRDVTEQMLLLIQHRYGIDLGIAASTPGEVTTLIDPTAPVGRQM